MNFLTDIYRNNLLGDDTFDKVNLDADTIAIMLIDNSNDIIYQTDESLDDVVSSARIPVAAPYPSLDNKTLGVLDVGRFDADDVTFIGLSGDQSEQLLLFKDTGVASTSILIACWDTFTSGMPLTPNGGDVTIQWSVSGIFGV